MYKTGGGAHYIATTAKGLKRLGKCWSKIVVIVCCGGVHRAQRDSSTSATGVFKTHNEAKESPEEDGSWSDPATHLATERSLRTGWMTSLGLDRIFISSMNRAAVAEE